MNGSLLLHTRTEPAEQTADHHAAAAATSVFNGRIVCSEPGRQSISCFDAVTGKNIWSVPHTGSDNRTLPGKDLHVLLHDENRLILTGAGHCRCLDPATGQQKWLVVPGNLSGAGVVSDDYCLLPIRGGTTAIADLGKGCLLPGSRVALPIRVHSFVGACSVQHDQIFSATCGSVTAWPATELILRKHPGLPTTQLAAVENLLQPAMAEARLSDAAALALRGAVLRNAKQDAAADAVDGLHTDLLLETLVDTFNGTPADRQSLADLLQRILSLKPDDRRMTRAAMLAALLGIELPAGATPQQTTQTLRTIVPVSANWSISPLSSSVLSRSLGRRPNELSEISAALVEESLLHPGSLPHTAQRLALLKLLQSSGMHEAADLWGCRWLNDGLKNRPAEIDVARNSLIEMRRSLQTAVSALTAPK
ncbi:MAG: hypothetical protein ACKON9_19440, partial [Planctomycetaceae bacterium]